MTASEPESPILLDQPRVEDGAAIWQLVQRSPPLDVNSCYAYLLVCQHFAATSAVARREAEVVGFASGYVPPGQPETLFIWQVAVDASARGQGLAGRMIEHIARRPANDGLNRLETTVSPSNEASANLFRSLARRWDAACRTETLFDREHFGEASHEEEVLYRIGPYTLKP